jgi:diguanylate cyclase (GGDEF)-like protein/PAS domain S-box-containing protein
MAQDAVRPSYDELQERLTAAETTLSAIRYGEVDALVVKTDHGDQVFTLEGADEFYRVLLEQMPLGVAGLDRHGTILFANPHLARMLGVRPERLVGLEIFDFLPMGRREAAQAAFLRSSAGELPEVAELVNASGATFPVAVTLRLLPGEEAATTCLIVGDLSDLQLELEGAHQRYAAVFETASEGVWTTDEHDIITSANTAMADLLGYRPGELIGRCALDFYAPTSLPEARHSSARHQRGVSDRRELHLLGKDGRELSVRMSSDPMLGKDGSYVGVLAMVTDISEQRRMEDRLERLQTLADHDPLTGLNNRRRLIEELDHSLAAAARYHRSGAVLMIDIDNFKVINDTFGHAAGDLVLQSVATVLSSDTRETDHVARLGGDEFAVLIPEGGEVAARREARSLLAHVNDSTIDPPVQLSIGISSFGNGGLMTADEVLAAADIALYEAKEQGGNQACVYAGQSHALVSVTQEIRDAITEDRLVLYGQPIIDLTSDAVVRHEVLVRMLSRDGRLIPPSAFLPSAERFGLICEIDEWVNETALRCSQQGMPVAINLSGRSIGRQSIITTLRQAIGRGLDPAGVVYEVTETAALTDVATARTFADALLELGCELALDDFGTGFASFTYLKHLPARYLKIDMEFIQHITEDDTDKEVVKSMVGIAHSLGMQTVAEGVEDAATLELVRSFGVDLAQGFHVGRQVALPSP